MEHEHEHEFVLEIPEFEHLSYEVEEGIALVTLKRPEALNALSQSLLEELAEIPELVQQDPEVRAVIFTGEGKAFAAGADLKEIAAIKDPFMGREYALFGQRVFAEIAALPVPTIAAINGAAAGVGLVIACWCDPVRVWYIIPTSAKPTKCIRLFAATARSSSKYEKFRENWSPFYDH